MADIAIFRINYKSDFILTLNSDAGWMTPFCIKFWTGAPSQAYFVGFDGTTYTHCAPVDGEPTKLRVQFDDHHLPIGDLQFQIAYHFTVADFPTSVEDEVLNQASVIIEVDDAPAQVMLDFNGETAPEIEFSLPAYDNEAQRIANEQQRIANEQQRIANEEARIQAEETRQHNEQQRINHETARVNEFARLKRESEQATTDANAAATLANEKAQLAADKAALAQAAATLANEKAQMAADKAALAQAAATLANEKAALAQQKAEYAQTQGDYAKEQGTIAEEDHARAEQDHERAESDHAALENVPESVPSTSPTDLSGSVEDVYLKNRLNNNPQAPRTLARLVTDSAKNRPLNESLTKIAEYQSLGFPAFSTSVDYAEGDPCFHDRRLYKAKAGGHSAGTWNAAHFEEFSVKEYTDAHVGIFDVSANNHGAVFASLQALLSDANLNTLIPAQFRRGGITITFIQGENAQSYDNKYVQYRLMADSWSIDPNDWSVHIEIKDDVSSDLSFSDENGNVILMAKEGHVKTKGFDSALSIQEGEDVACRGFVIADSNGKVGLLVNEGHVITKNFDSSKALTDNLVNEAACNGFCITDENGHVALLINEGNIITKNFDSSQKNNTLKIFIFGSSYAYGSFAYLPALLQNMSVCTVTLGIAYYAGCTLAQHVQFIENDSAVYTYSEATGNSPFTNTPNKTALECFNAQDWDIVIFQPSTAQSRSISYIRNGANDYLNYLINWVYAHTEKSVRLGWHLMPSWSDTYQVDGHDFNESEEMWTDICDIAQTVMNEYPIDVLFPCGTAIQNARHTSLDNLNWGAGHLDYNVHLQMGLAWQIASYSACMVISNLIGSQKGIFGDDLRFTQNYVNSMNINAEVAQGPVLYSTDEYCKIGQKCAIAAYKNNYQLSTII